MEFIHQPSPSNRLGDYLKDGLSGSWTHFRAAVALVKRSGTRHVARALADFARAGHVEIIAGIDHQGTSVEGLQDLLEAVSPKGRVVIFHNRLPFTFHPKIYLFKSPIAAEVMIGSGNLTEGGLFTNYEAALRLSLDLSDPERAALLRSIEKILDTWADPATGTARVLDDALLVRLTALGLVPSEASTASEFGDVERDDDRTRSRRIDLLFATHAESRAPPFPNPATALAASLEESDRATTPSPPAPESPGLGVTGFVMTLQRTDVGVGQTTAGTTRRSSEIFIPLAARDAEPDFWNWPGGFTPDPRRSYKFDRHAVRMRLDGEIVSVNMMIWPVKRDFRLRSESLRSAGDAGDVLRMEKVDPTAGYEYDAEVIPPGTSRHLAYLARCRQSVRNSRKKDGYY